MDKLLKGQQIPVAASLSHRAESMLKFVKGLAEEARAEGLIEFADGFDVLAAGTARMSVQLDTAARRTYFAARQGEKLPS